MAAFVVIVAVVALISGLFTYVSGPMPVLPPTDDTGHYNVELIAKADDAVAKIRHAASAGSARTALGRAEHAAEKAGSPRHVRQARKVFVDRIHKLANEEEIKGNPWKAADILVQCAPFAPNAQAVHDAADVLRGGGAKSNGGGIF